MAKKKKVVATKTKKKAAARRVGKTSGVGVLATWVKLFEANAKRKLTDGRLLEIMKKEFPGYAAKSKIFSNVTAHRRFYNKGMLGAKPKKKSKRYQPD